MADVKAKAIRKDLSNSEGVGPQRIALLSRVRRRIPANGPQNHDPQSTPHGC